MTDIVNFMERKKTKMSEYENFKKRERLEQVVYEKMCFACPNARKCHENCEFCDDFENEVERLVNLQ